MAIKFEKITPGMELLDIHRTKMGNTTMSELGLWKVRVISVDPATRTALVSWNSNPQEKYHERDLTRLYTKPPKAYLEQQERRRRNGNRL
jgi:hypothetical protein